MLNGYPEEEELRRRILNQLSWHASSDVVGVLWLGYLAGLLEWGVIDIDVYGRLKNLLPLVGGQGSSRNVFRRTTVFRRREGDRSLFKYT
jgi:hypothetical protein